MSLRHETARYSRKSRPNDASETSKADQMMSQRHHLDGFVKGLSRGQPWVCDPQESRNSSWAPWVDMRRVYLVIAVVIAHKSRPNDASEAWNCSFSPQKPSKWCLWGMKLLVIATEAVQMMPLRHETSCYSRKTLPDDASEAWNCSWLCEGFVLWPAVGLWPARGSK